MPSSTVQILIELTTNMLLFLLIFGMSATVDSRNLRRQLQNKGAIVSGVLMQFLIMPFLGFIAVYTLQDHGLTIPMGISLLIVTTSPGGSYSNWWCSLFNADLALSVAMTALSTILSTALLPANLLLYSWLAYGLDEERNILESINFAKLFISISIVIVAIIFGLYASFSIDSPKFRKFANHGGSIAGVLLIVFSAVFSSTSEAETKPWKMGWGFWVATIVPCCLGLTLSNIIAARFVKLQKPEVVTLSVECCYQNVGIATSAAVSMFQDGTEIAEALAVPLVYGMVEIVVLGTYCVLAWKMGWTKAPKEEAICTVLCTSFEIEQASSLSLTTGRPAKLRKSQRSISGGSMVQVGKYDLERVGADSCENDDDDDGCGYYPYNNLESGENYSAVRKSTNTTEEISCDLSVDFSSKFGENDVEIPRAQNLECGRDVQIGNSILVGTIVEETSQQQQQQQQQSPPPSSSIDEENDSVNTEQHRIGEWLRRLLVSRTMNSEISSSNHDSERLDSPSSQSQASQLPSSRPTSSQSQYQEGDEEIEGRPPRPPI